MTRIVHGDCVAEMRAMKERGEVVHAVVCDPPYGLSNHTPQEVADCLMAWAKGEEYKPKGLRGFMGRSWDAWVPGPEAWRAAYDLLPPGGHMLVFAGTRTVDLMGIAIRLAGFEIRDTVSWVYGSGFPKSYNLDGEWEGWGTALKPAHEPIIVARKPLVGTVAQNVLQHGTGAISVDACRVDYTNNTDIQRARVPQPNLKDVSGRITHLDAKSRNGEMFDPSKGRWPANLIHDGSEEVEEAFAAFGDRGGGDGKDWSQHRAHGTGQGATYLATKPTGQHYADTGTASRFFYSAKAGRADRVTQCLGCGVRSYGKPECACADAKTRSHPTTKPLALMQYLVRLVTPPGGTVLDPFMGSGSTVAAAAMEGFYGVGIDLEGEHVGDAAFRMASLPEGRKETKPKREKATRPSAKYAPKLSMQQEFEIFMQSYGKENAD